MKNIVFVYGTLRKTFNNHALISNSRFIGAGRTCEKFVMFSRLIPFLSDSQKVSTIYGEVYEVDDKTLSALDRLEGYKPNSPSSSWYRRSFINVNIGGEVISALCYFNDKETAPIVLSGDFADAQNIEQKSSDLFYFAYGSNMNPARMIKRGINFTSRERCFIPNFTLKFNKIAYNLPGEAYANIEPCKGHVTHGLLYRVTGKDLLILDKKEGVSSGHYYREEVMVNTDFGIKKAICYIACHDRTSEDIYPSQNYLNHLHKGGDLLGQTLLNSISTSLKTCR